MLYDGTGAVPFTADILLEDGYIKEIGQFSKEDFQESDTEIIEAKNKAVTPGFIDSHRHADFAVFTQPEFGKAELAQGITTCLVGNCGMSAAPSFSENHNEWYDFIEPCLGRVPKGLYFPDTREYLDLLENHKVPINMGSLIGMGSLKTAIKGFQNFSWNADEIKKGNKILMNALEAGAWGISCGIMYVPECYTTFEEYVKILKPAAFYKRPLVCHIRSEGDRLLEAVDEVIHIGKETEIPIHISHFKVFGRRNWKRTLPYAIEKIEKARTNGQDITVDFYPYTGGATTLMTLIPPCCMKESTEKTIEFLNTPEGKGKLRKEIMQEQPGWDNMVQSIGWDRVLISSVVSKKNQACQGLNIPQICEKFGDEDETACVTRLLYEEEGKAGIIVMSMDPEDVDLVAKLPYAAVISDALYGAPEFPHPRLYGSFPRVLRDFVMERNVLTKEEAIHKMSGLPAKRFNIHKRGLLKPGFKADMNIFKWEEIYDKATFTNPKKLSEGIDRVLLDGITVWNKGHMIEKYCGNVLRA